MEKMLYKCLSITGRGYLLTVYTLGLPPSGDLLVLQSLSITGRCYLPTVYTLGLPPSGNLLVLQSPRRVVGHEGSS